MQSHKRANRHGREAAWDKDYTGMLDSDSEVRHLLIGCKTSGSNLPSAGTFATSKEHRQLSVILGDGIMKLGHINGKAQTEPRRIYGPWVRTKDY